MALWENVIGYGPHADRPAAGAPGALYCESDTHTVWRDSGTSWDQVAGIPTPVPLDVLHTATDLDLSAAHVLVVITAGTPTITLPDPTLWPGQEVRVGGAPSVDFNLHDFGGAEIGAGWAPPITVVSDGVVWLSGDG